MLRNNINSVRTCHYPDQIPWYYMCDDAGIYVMAETNLESHGSFQKLGAIEPSCNVPGSIPQWRDAVLERAKNNFETFKNHTSILFWSLGNESYAGDDIEAMNVYFAEKKDGRLVHYESAYYNRAYEDTISDFETRMYAKPEDVEEYLNNSPKKPYILCEFMHDMGNSMGGLGSYMKLIDKYDMYHGGFIWDFIDQAIMVKDPVIVLNMVSAVMFKDMGISDARIAFWTSLIMWPWTIKFLWSPFLEIFRTKKFFVVTTQLLSGVLFGLAALALHMPHFFAVTVGVFAVVAFSGATHDIAADGVYMSELSTGDQARYIGWQGAFYNLAKLVATGGLVWFAGWLSKRFSDSGAATFDAYVQSWTVVLAILCGLLVLLGIYHSRELPSGGSAADGHSLREGLRSLKEVIAAFFTKKHIWYYIAFIVFYRLGEGFVMKIVPLFLKADTAAGGLGLTNQQIGLYYGTFGAGAFLLGSLLAGYYIAHRGLRRSLFTLCCIFNLPFAVYALLAWFQPQSMWLVGGGIVVEYFGYGFGFVGLTLFMMQQVAPGRHQMAHYAFASGIMNLSVMLTGAVSGYLSDWKGYGVFFIVVMLATIPAFVMTWFVPFTYDDKPTTK